MSALALTAALYGVAAAQKWSFSVFLALQGAPSSRASSCSCKDIAYLPFRMRCPFTSSGCYLFLYEAF